MSLSIQLLEQEKLLEQETQFTHRTDQLKQPQQTVSDTRSIQPSPLIEQQMLNQLLEKQKKLLQQLAQQSNINQIPVNTMFY